MTEFDATSGARGVNPEHIEAAFEERFRRADVADVALEDFLEFHHDVSAGIDSDRIFEAFVRNTWHYNG